VKFPGHTSEDGEESKSSSQASYEGSVQLSDCLAEFEKPELLDEDNQWYCPKCKNHVQATKSLQIYKAPLVLVVSLKRFKHGKRVSYGYGGMSSGGGKLQTLVEFPI